MKVRWYHFLAGGPVVLAWIWTWWYLALEWSANEQYQFGFVVPLLGLYLGFQRWPDRLLCGKRTGLIFTLVAFPILFLAELLRVTDPLWRLTGVVWMTGSTLLTVGYFCQFAGWTLVKRMIFPLGFLWVGLPWPMPLENLVIQVLSFRIASITVTLFNVAGIPALQRGNVIEIGRQLVGVDAACSGIQSLQASVMASLFLWGAFRLSPLRGMALQFAGISISIALNLGRVIALTYCAHRFGTQNLMLHNWVGGIATLLIFGGIYLGAIWLRGPVHSRATNLRRPIPGLNFGVGSRFPISSGVFLFAAFLMIPLSARVIAGFENKKGSAVKPQWRVSLDDLPAGWSASAFSATPIQAEMLRFTDWEGFHVRMPDGLWAEVVHLFWKSGRGIPSIAFYHTPALCLPATGWQMIGEPEPVELHVYGDQVGFVRYAVEREDEKMAALQFVSHGSHNGLFFAASISEQGPLARLAQLWRGSRHSVNEEILLYLPEMGSGSDRDFANEVFSKLFKPAGL